jgi:putative photosynthetic complex assembly protein
MSPARENLVPKPVLVGAGLLIVSTLVFVGSVQYDKHLHHRGNAPEIDFGRPIVTRLLRFVDARDGVNAFGGHVTVFDAKTGAELPQLRENDGFVRTVLNSLAYERTKEGGESAAPVFALTAWTGGPLTLSDTATGKRVEVSEFGPDNEAKFLRFLPRSNAQ